MHVRAGRVSAGRVPRETARDPRAIVSAGRASGRMGLRECEWPYSLRRFRAFSGMRVRASDRTGVRLHGSLYVCEAASDLSGMRMRASDLT